MWQSKREISRECNDIIGSAKGSQISEKYWGEVGKGKRADIYLEVRKRKGHIFFEWNKCLCLHSRVKSVCRFKIFPYQISSRTVHFKTNLLESFLILLSWILTFKDNINYLFSNLTEQFLTNYYSYFFCVLQCFRKVCRYELYALKLPLGGI